MAHHSKWHNIRVKKGAADKKRGKIFTKHAKLIEICAREGGGDIGMNPTLRMLIDNARLDNVPNANIERAVKKGTGELSEGEAASEFFLEGYGPSGVALYIQILTDSRNRAVSSVKTILSKNGGNLGAAGSVGFLFDRRGLIVAKPAVKTEGFRRGSGGSGRSSSGAGGGAAVDLEALELAAIDAGASDVKVYSGDSEEDTGVDDSENFFPTFEIYTEPTELAAVKKKLLESGFVVEKSELTFLPKTEVAIFDAATAEKILNLIGLLEEDEDVTNVFANCQISEELMKNVG